MSDPSNTRSTIAKPRVRARQRTLDVFTVGYAGRTLDEFITTLLRARIERVVDVRALPLSRRKGFSKSPLRQALVAAGIEYVHLKVAGNPHRSAKGDIERCLALYSAHVDANPDVIEAVEDAVSNKRSVLLCVEETAHGCHRSVITDRLRRRSPRLSVEHL